MRLGPGGQTATFRGAAAVSPPRGYVASCARRLGYRADTGVDPAAALLRDHRAHTEAVHLIFETVLGGQGSFGTA